jgi:hypothetical protein
MKEKINVIVETTGTGYSAYTKDHPVYTTGANKIELQDNMVDAFQFYSYDKGSDRQYLKEDFQFFEETTTV